MEVGLILLWEPGERGAFEARVRTSERLGYSFIGVGDSPGVYREMTTSLALASTNTSRCLLGPMVSTPMGRHPVVIANALSTLHELTGGRVLWGLGSGGSAAEAMGRRAATRDELRTFIAAVRALMRGESIDWDGTTAPAMRDPRAVPIYLSAYGPATMRLAGEVADGVIFGVGASAELIQRFRGEVARGAEAAGRSPEEIDVWALARVSVGADRIEALTDVKASLASGGSFGLRSRSQMASVPEQWRARIRELQRRYDPAQHLIWDGRNAQLVDELGLGDYLIERFGIVGTPPGMS